MASEGAARRRSRAVRPFAELRDMTEMILESISDGVFTVDDEWRITSFNRAAEQITGVPRSEALGRRCCEVFRASTCEVDCALRKTMESGRPVANQAAFIVDATGRRIPIGLSTTLLRDGRGRVVGGAETFRDLSAEDELRRELAGRRQVGDLASRSPAMRRVLDLLPALAASDATVLILGETGTGKELVARAIHGLGPRREGPFIAVNCAALPQDLLESELFGYRAGAFTGAVRDKPGRLALAEGGSLFLDEVAELGLGLQAKLLRVLQERTFEPLGATASLKWDARVLAATNRDLAALVREGLFREDLYYRLNVVSVPMPPLRRRREDLPLLVEQLIERLNASRHRSVPGVSPEVLSVLSAHDFPGNVRELENLLERAFVLCGGGRIEVRHLPDELAARRPRGAAAGLDGTVRAAEEEAIREALVACRFDRAAAARSLGLHRSTLFRKMAALRMELPALDGRHARKGRA